ncbi:MAG: bifunctional DNA primase/polymerase [Anaerolineae bacterium]|nr:bifunctional DNA primase/polymerase [Anaerolineae bacterium]
MDKLELVRLITKRGWTIFPQFLDKETGDKRPYLKHGYLDASLNKSKIDLWLKKWPDCLIGIPCEPNLFFAVDVDPDGLETWAKWVAENGEPVVGPRQKTPRGGFHLLFKLPVGLQVPNVAGKIGVGIDLRSKGSITTNVTGYQWGENGHGVDAPLTDAPEWILDKIRVYLLEREKKWESFNSGNYEEIDPESAGEFWLQKSLSLARPGNRHETGFLLACQLRDSRVSRSQAETILRTFAQRVSESGNPFPVQDVLYSLRDAYKTPPREPARLRNIKNPVIPGPPAETVKQLPGGEPVTQPTVHPSSSIDRSEIVELPVGLILRSDQIDKLDVLAKEMGIRQHELLRKIIGEYLGKLNDIVNCDN